MNIIKLLKNILLFINPVYRKINSLESKIDNLTKDISRKNQELLNDTNVIFKYLSSGLELHPFDGKLHRIITANYQNAKDNHIIRYNYSLKYLKKNDKILDLATGVGYGCSLISDNIETNDIIGLDYSEAAIEYAKRVFSSDKITFLQGDGLNKKLFDEADFNKIISFETIEHIVDSSSLLNNFHYWLKKDGLLIGSVPNEDVIPFDNKKYTHHIRHYTKESLKSLLENVGFEVIDICHGGWNKIPVETPDYTLIFVAKKIL